MSKEANDADIDVDISDEQQDWRFLNAIDRSGQSLPKRGEKDYEPDGTGLQVSTLAESRAAMYKALEGERKHSSKNHVSATWFGYIGKARVDVVAGPHFMTMGKADSSGVIWLLPEEVIYLVERGSMECWWPEGAPMSLQAVYSTCIKAMGDIEKLQVYSYLRKIGFIVQRATSYDPDFRVLEQRKLEREEALINMRNKAGYSGLLRRSFLMGYNNCVVSPLSFISRQLARRAATSNSTLLWRSVYRSYESIYSELNIIPCHRPPHLEAEVSDLDIEEPAAPFRVMFDVWKPGSTFKKASPGKPDYRIVVVSARDDKMPSLNQTASLFASVPVSETTKDKSQMQRLKEGWRTVILAVVDAGIISLFKLSDVGFGDEKMYIRPPPKPRAPRTRKNQSKKS
ncbi:Sen54p [Sugiyamaella lignohabitans]|uniref:Sen54p n=1 Tax=Sugiyamaella lignohabitans TaxID=796027 RepID=A0A167FJ13_9ASCO|nr:Sen54p [Sugiyamaella lignohabitans]ANB15365.1 Sen54p [Sugiyamaella lignohabitans]